MKYCKVKGCGSYALNLHHKDIDQGDLCDVHYWQNKAETAIPEGHVVVPVESLHNGLTVRMTYRSGETILGYSKIHTLEMINNAILFSRYLGADCEDMWRRISEAKDETFAAVQELNKEKKG